MIGRRLFLAARLLAAAVFLLTWAYGVTTYSPFAFDMFIRPQLLPELATFVTWHHLWYWAAYLLAVLSLFPDLMNRRRRPAWWASLLFVAVFGVVGAHLITTPVLASLTSGSRSTLVVPGALLPIAWLAIIDHLAGGFPAPAERPQSGSHDSHPLKAGVASAAFVCASHLALSAGLTDAPPSARLMTGAWALVLDLALVLAATLVFAILTSLAAFSRRRFVTEYVLAVVAVAVALTEIGRRIILPSFAFSTADAAAISVAFGATTAMMWSGLRVRSAPNHTDTPLRYLLSPASGGNISALVWLAAITLMAHTATAAIAQIDWALILQTLIALVEVTLVFGVFLEVLANRATRAWPIRLVALPLAVLAAVHALPYFSARAAAAARDPRLDASAVLDRLPAHDPLAGFAAAQLIEQTDFDLDFYQEVIATERRQSTVDPQPHADIETSAFMPNGSPPNVLFIVVDSLRRDYLSPYNPTVTFTPEIQAWARDSFVFRNAFTPYGGTWLAMPSIWTGTAVTRGWTRVFERINALESLIVGGKYEFVINDFTIETNLKASTARTFLDRDIPSLETDLCRNLESLKARTLNRPHGSAPLFVYLAPMNIHILNTQGRAPSSERYGGFYEPYAARVERVDGCFGEFIRHFKEQGLYDNSIIVLTSDHGDLLGEDGRWGHQFHLFPEAIRIPMIVHLPAQLRDAHTTDLSRISFLTDLAPSLQALLGRRPAQPAGVMGSPLFVPADQSPTPRRRDSFLVMSSYGSTYGLLRRNGRLLYISDLLNWRDHAYRLFIEPNGERIPVTGAIRRINQRGVRQQLDRIDEMFRRR